MCVKKQAVFKEKQRKCSNLSQLCGIISEFGMWSRSEAPREQEKRADDSASKLQTTKGLFYRNWKLE